MMFPPTKILSASVRFTPTPRYSGTMHHRTEEFHASVPIACQTDPFDPTIELWTVRFKPTARYSGTMDHRTEEFYRSVWIGGETDEFDRTSDLWNNVSVEETPAWYDPLVPASSDTTHEETVETEPEEKGLNMLIVWGTIATIGILNILLNIALLCVISRRRRRIETSTSSTCSDVAMSAD
jgi:hypothetical protein